jgi:hypothetical protein
MRYIFILIFLSLGSVLFGQEKNVTQILRYNRNEGIIFDFSNDNKYFLLNKYFGYSFNKISTNEDNEFNENLIKNFNYNLLSKNNELGIVNYTDTIKINPKLNFEDINFAIKNILIKNSSYKYKESKYGYYLITLIIRQNFYSDNRYTISLSIRPNEIIINANFKLGLYDFDILDFDTEMQPYNAPLYSYDKEMYYSGRIVERKFRPTKAFHQLYTFASISEVRKRVKDIIELHLNDILQTKNN